MRYRCRMSSWSFWGSLGRFCTSCTDDADAVENERRRLGRRPSALGTAGVRSPTRTRTTNYARAPVPGTRLGSAWETARQEKARIKRAKFMSRIRSGASTAAPTLPYLRAAATTVRTASKPAAVGSLGCALTRLGQDELGQDVSSRTSTAAGQCFLQKLAVWARDGVPQDRTRKQVPGPRHLPAAVLVADRHHRLAPASYAHENGRVHRGRPDRPPPLLT